MICKQCGTYVQEGTPVCPQCGRPTDPTAGADLSAARNAAGRKPGQRAYVLGLTAAVLVLVISTVMLILSLRRPDKGKTTVNPPTQTAALQGEVHTAAPTHPVQPETQRPVETEQEPDTEEPPETEPIIPEVGDIVTFGSYEQDGSNADGEEPIEWIVLDRDGTQVLLLSRYGLDRTCYSIDANDASWSGSWLRDWLNDSFYSRSFTWEERERIVETWHPAEPNPTDPDLWYGYDTWDMVFLLSPSEVSTYLPTAEDRKCVPTQYLVEQGAYVNEGCCWWWLRSPGTDESCVMGITTLGAIHYAGSECYDPGSLRPAIWVDFGD